MSRLALLIGGLALSTTTAVAQQAGTDGMPPAPVAAASEAPMSVQGDSAVGTNALKSGPTTAAAAAAYQPSAREMSASEAAALLQRRRMPERQAVTLMIVGGGMLLGGLIIGDDAGTIIAVGGLVVGLIGLYNYVQ